MARKTVAWLLCLTMVFLSLPSATALSPYEGNPLGKTLASVTVVTDTAWYKSASPEEQAMAAVKLDGAISYTFPERSLRVDYSVSPGTVKENFVLLAPSDGRFKLTLSGLTAEQKAQTVSLFNEEGEELFVIAAPYMYDAAGVESDEIELVLTDENTLLVLPNEEWLNDTSRVYPVTIDPTYMSGGAGGDAIADDVYYITNKATGKYMTVNGDLNMITEAYQYTQYSSEALETSRARQMWKVKYLGNGYYSIRPLHELFYGLWRSDASSNELMIYNIGTTDTVAGVVSNAQWSITGSSGNYSIKKHGDNDKTLYLTTTTSQEVVKCGTGPNNNYSKWNFKPVSSPPQGAYMCDTSTHHLVTNPTRYVAPGETRTLDNMNLKAVAYSPNTISQTFTCASSDTNVATVNAYGAVTGVSPGTAIITGTSSCGETTRFTVSVTEIANGTYFLKNKETGRYADIENHTMSGGTQIEQQDFDGDNAQRWIFTHLGDGYYSIKSANSASTFYMGVSGDSTGNDVPVVLRAASLTDGAKWRISKTSSGAYKITAKTGEANDRVLAVGAYVLNTNGVDIEQRESANPTNYRDEWFLQRPENPELHIFMECKVPTGNFSIQCVGEKATGTTWYPLIQASANAWNNSGAGTSIVVDTSSSPYTCEVNLYAENWYGLTTSYFPDGSTTSATIKINSRTCASDTNSRKSTITHEIGHLLGLEDDPPVPEDQSLMNHGRNRSTVYEPQEYDVVNVNYIYSLN